MRKTIVTLTLAGLAVAFGASPGGAGGGNVEQFCKAWLAVDRAADEPSERQLERATSTAPAGVVEPLEAALGLLEVLDENPFADSTFTGALAVVEEFVVENCGYEQIDVTMEDYSFTGVPTEIEKGKVAFSLINEGAELHELSVYRLKGNNTLEDVLELPADASENEFLELVTPIPGGGFGFPGARDTAFFNLKKTGNYVALCVIPVGTTPDTIQGEGEGGTGPPHALEGMAGEFEVVK